MVSQETGLRCLFRWIVPCLALLWLGAQPALAEAEWQRKARSMGLPTNYFNERDLYRLVVEENRFVLVPPSEVKARAVYLRWVVGEGWAYCTGDDRRPILVGSKVQGFRLGLSGQRAHNWYELLIADGELWWSKSTKRKRPEVYRKLPTGEAVLSERAPDDWVTWGGELDPIPGVKPPPKPEPEPYFKLGQAVWYLAAPAQSWDGAWETCAKLGLGGKRWRLPNVYELGWAFEKLRDPSVNPLFGEAARGLPGAWTDDEPESPLNERYFIDFVTKDVVSAPVSRKLGVICAAPRG